MYRKILVGYDDSDQAKDALAFGKLLAERTGAELALGGVFLVHLPLRGGIDPLTGEDEAELAKQLEQVADSVEAAAQPVQSTSPARGLHELAEEIEADLIVVGSSRHGRVGQTLVGNVGVALLHGSPCAVAIAPQGYRDRDDQGIETIVVGFDGSAEAGLALMAASELAQETGATIKLVSVAEPPPVGTGKGGSDGWHALKEAIEQQMRDVLTEACESVPDGVEAEAILVGGEPAEALSEIASESGSVLIVGSRAYGPLRRVLLGSVSRALVGSAPAPVIVNPRGMHEPAREMRAAQAETAS